MYDHYGLGARLWRTVNCTLVSWYHRGRPLSWCQLLPQVCLFLSHVKDLTLTLRSCWYKRKEFGIRAAIFFSAAALAGSFGGLLAAAIANMDGVGGKPGWAWIFILEGLATVLIALASFWMVHDFPDEATFLSDDDRRRVIRRLKEDKQSSAEHEEFKIAYVWATLKDWKTYTGTWISQSGPSGTNLLPQACLSTWAAMEHSMPSRSSSRPSSSRWATSRLTHSSSA